MAARNARGRAGWAVKINECLQMQRDIPFQIGDRLTAAREEIPHGEWLAFVRDDLRRSRPWATMHIRVARDTRLRRANVLALLPADVTLLDQISRLDDEALQRRIEDGTINPDMGRADLKAAARREQAAELRDNPPPLPEGKFRCIYADPPWDFQTWGDNGEDRSPPYPTVPTADLCAMPVGDLAADDCALFLWAVPSMATDAYRVLAAWGFRFVTIAFVWVKQGAPGMGYWTRQRAEPCLLATRGSPMRLDEGVDQVIQAARDDHSAKPHETYERIERLVAGPYVELFHRGAVRAGWHAWGNQSESLPPTGSGGSR